MNNYYIRVFILFVLVLIEVLSSTFWMDTMPIESCRWLYLLSGLGISFYLMLRPIHREQSTSHQSLRWIPLILLLILVLWVVPSFYKIYISNALDYTHADMLPVIRVMCNRWLQHEYVYSVISDFWNGTTPIYLPAMWMPFIPATLFSFDLRWITLGLMCIGIIFIFLRKNNSWIALLFFLFIGLWFDYLIHNRTETFRLSQEGVVYFSAAGVGDNRGCCHQQSGRQRVGKGGRGDVIGCHVDIGDGERQGRDRIDRNA